MLGVSRATIYKLLNSGSIRAVKLGNRTLVSAQALREFSETLPAYKPALEGYRIVKGTAVGLLKQKRSNVCVPLQPLRQPPTV